jgi:hypothetical protein
MSEKHVMSFLKYMYMDDLESFLGPAKLLHCGQII